MQILGVRVDCVDFQQTLALISGWVALRRTPDAQSSYSARQVCTVNPEFIMHARQDPAFGQVLAAADLCTPDGVGVLWAARLAGARLGERVTGSDGIYRLCERAGARGWRVFFLGAAAGIAAAAAEELTKLYPGLSVAGAFSGSPAEADWPQIQRRLRDARPDLLFVAYGHPRQDIWIQRHRDELPVAVALGVGGAFDFVAGVTQRAPVWVQRLGLEWLYRLMREPWRWRRMTMLPVFALLVVVEWARKKVRGASHRGQ